MCDNVVLVLRNVKNIDLSRIVATVCENYESSAVFLDSSQTFNPWQNLHEVDTTIDISSFKKVSNECLLKIKKDRFSIA